MKDPSSTSSTTENKATHKFRNPLLNQSTGIHSALFTPERFLMSHMEFIIHTATSLSPAAEGNFLCRGVLIAWERRRARGVLCL